MRKERLAIEVALLEAKFPNRYVFRDMDTNAPFLDCSVKSHTGKSYRLKITLDGFPLDKPDVYITYPKPLPSYEGEDLAHRGVSSSLHLLEADEEGNVQICHYNNDWDGGNTTLVNVMIHAKMWIEAYEHYRRTGDDIDIFLKH